MSKKAQKKEAAEKAAQALEELAKKEEVLALLEENKSLVGGLYR